MIMLSAFSFSGILIAVTCVIMATAMFVFGRNRTNFIWGIFCLTVFVWGFGVYAIGRASSAGQALWYWRLAYVGVILIPPLFAHFVRIFLDRRVDLIVVYSYVLAGVYIALDLSTDFFIQTTHRMFGELYYLSPTNLYTSFVCFFIVLTVHSHYLLWQAYKKSEAQRRQQILFFLGGSSIGFFGGSFGFLPVYGLPVYPYMNVLIALFPVIMGYAIFRYQLFSPRVILGQTLVFAIWLFVGVRLSLSWGTPQALMDGILLGVVIVLGILLIQSIIREANQRERLQQLNEIKSEYLAFASHQVKAPMTAVKGFATLIYDGSYGEVPEKIKEAAGKIRDAANRMIMTVNNILNIRRIEEGKIEYHFATKDLNVLAFDVVEELRPLASAKGLTLTFEPTQELAATYIDEQYFRQVLQNIIENAIKYTDLGSVAVRVSRDGQDVICSVVDSGRGMSRDDLAHLFEEFRRAPGATRTADGTGLGLYLAKQIVDAHHGRIWAMSRGEGEGTTFFVQVPFVDATHTDKVSSGVVS
jgi:signal transduction histidine kinase